VYYGQEMFLSGGRDPNNREALWDHGYIRNNLIKLLNKLRQVAISKDPKFITTHSSYIYHDDYQLFYQKRKLLVGLNGQGKDRGIAPYDLTLHGTPYTAGETLVDVIACESTIAGNGQVVVRMKDGAPVVLYPKSLLAGSGICRL
jgi:alpha-amylase